MIPRSQFLIVSASLAVIFIALLLLTWNTFHSAGIAAKTASNRYQSYQMAEEFRLTSSNLTRNARAYRATKRKDYLDRYNAILDWQSGRIPRPPDMELFPGIQKGQIALMRDLGFSEEELKTMNEALVLSDELAEYEIQTSESIEKGYIVPGPAKPLENETVEAFSLRVLYDENYKEFEDKIEQKIRQFFSQLDARTSKSVRNAEATLYTISVIVCALQLISLIILATFTNTIVNMMLKDKLTGAYTKRCSERLIQNEINAAARGHKNLTLMMLDLDHFKKINDTYGHNFGDKVLSCESETIRSSLRQRDCLIRFGGEEFIAIFPEVNEERAMEIAERIRLAVAATEIFNEQKDVVVRMTISIGITCLGDSTFSVREFIENADKALYVAKESRNCAVMFNRAMLDAGSWSGTHRTKR